MRPPECPCWTGCSPRSSTALARAYTALARRHNNAGVTAELDPTTRTYHERPARVLMADRFTEATLSTVTDSVLSALPPIGGIDQVVDNTDVLADPAKYRRLAHLYDVEN